MMPVPAYPSGPSTPAAMRGLRGLGSGDLSTIPHFLRDLAQRYGGIAHWTVFGRHFFFLDDPALIEEALVQRADDYRKGRGIQRLKRLLGDGLLTSDEPLHTQRRRLVQPAFHREKIVRYGCEMVTATDAQLDTWVTAGVRDLQTEMTRLTLAIAAQTLFSTNVAEEADRIRAALTSALRAFPASLSSFSELLDAVPILPVTRRFNRARAELDAVVYGMIAARRNGSDGEPDDLLQMLLDARDGDAALDDAAVRDEAMTLFLAGHETTANVLAWTWYLLARHPLVAERLHAELATVLRGRRPDAGDVPQLRYTRAVFAETMRLYPPAWILGRRALRATTLGPYAVPRGSVVIASQLITQRNPRYWTDPERFDPERWTAAADGRPRFAYFPFGGGSRRCIGEAFAWMEGILLIAAIAGRFTLEALDATPVEAEPLVTLRPRSPIRLRVRARVHE